jgi:hypothetical protein
LLIAVALIVGSSAVHAADAGAAPYRERWVYCSANLQVDKAADDVIALIERSSRDGYTAMLLADYKVPRLRRPGYYLRGGLMLCQSHLGRSSEVPSRSLSEPTPGGQGLL